MKKLLQDNIDTIFGYALFITGNREKALDLMQDTMVTVLRKTHLYTEQSGFKSWIFTILKNNYINTYKKANLHREITETDYLNDNVISGVFEDKKSATNSDPLLKDKIMSAFEQMPHEYKDVTYLVDVEGLKYEEVAESLSLPVGTVMSRLFRGREFLRKKLYAEAKEMNIVAEKKVRHAK